MNSDTCPRCGSIMDMSDSNVLTLRFSTSKRKKVWAKTGYRCWYCGVTPPEKEMTIDHVVPISRGGQSNQKNLVPCCMLCNSAKGSLRVEEFRELQIKRSQNLPRSHPFRLSGFLFAFELHKWRKA